MYTVNRWHSDCAEFRVDCVEHVDPTGETRDCCEYLVIKETRNGAIVKDRLMSFDSQSRLSAMATACAIGFSLVNKQREKDGLEPLVLA